MINMEVVAGRQIFDEYFPLGITNVLYWREEVLFQDRRRRQTLDT